MANPAVVAQGGAQIGAGPQYALRAVDHQEPTLHFDLQSWRVIQDPGSEWLEVTVLFHSVVQNGQPGVHAVDQGKRKTYCLLIGADGVGHMATKKLALEYIEGEAKQLLDYDRDQFNLHMESQAGKVSWAGSVHGQERRGMRERFRKADYADVTWSHSNRARSHYDGSEPIYGSAWASHDHRRNRRELKGVSATMRLHKEELDAIELLARTPVRPVEQDHPEFALRRRAEAAGDVRAEGDAALPQAELVNGYGVAIELRDDAAAFESLRAWETVQNAAAFATLDDDTL